MKVSIILMGIAVIALAIVQIVQAVEISKHRKLLNAVMVLVYTDLKARGKSPDDMVGDVVRMVMNDVDAKKRSGDGV